VQSGRSSKKYGILDKNVNCFEFPPKNIVILPNLLIANLRLPPEFWALDLRASSQSQTSRAPMDDIFWSVCGTGLTLCDVNVLGDAYQCGKCVGTALIATCLDRRCKSNGSRNACVPIFLASVAFLCSSTTSVFQCTTTMNCVLDDWLLDGSNECGDWSDESKRQ
jgi:hypothetical protein